MMSPEVLALFLTCLALSGIYVVAAVWSVFRQLTDHCHERALDKKERAYSRPYSTNSTSSQRGYGFHQQQQRYGSGLAPIRQSNDRDISSDSPLLRPVDGDLTAQLLHQAPPITLSSTPPYFDDRGLGVGLGAGAGAGAGAVGRRPRSTTGDETRTLATVLSTRDLSTLGEGDSSSASIAGSAAANAALAAGAKPQLVRVASGRTADADSVASPVPEDITGPSSRPLSVRSHINKKGGIWHPVPSVSGVRVARARAPTIPDLLAAKRDALKRRQGRTLEAATFVIVVAALIVQGTLIALLVHHGTLSHDKHAQTRFSVERVALLCGWCMNLVLAAVEECLRRPRSFLVRCWWPISWALELWFLLSHGWHGGVLSRAARLDLPECPSCDTLVPISFCVSTVATALAIVYACAHYSSTDAEVYREALAVVDDPSEGTYRKILRLIGRDRVLVGMALLGALMESGVNVAFNVLWGELIDAINEGNREDLTRLCIMLAIGSIVLGGAVFMESFCSVLAGARLVLRIQNFTFQSLMEQEQGFFDIHQDGELEDVLNVHTPSLKSSMTLEVTHAIEGCVTLLVVLVYLFVEAWELTLLALAGGAVPLIVMAVTRVWLVQTIEQLEDVKAAQHGTASEFVSAISTVKGLVHEEAAKRRYKAASIATYDVSRVVASGTASLEGFNIAVIYAVFVFVFWLGGSMVIDGELKVGFLVSIILLAFQMIEGLGKLADAIPLVREGRATARHVFDVLYRKPLDRYRGGERIQGGFRGAVELQHVRFCYPTKAKKSALRGVTLNVAAGQTIGLVGPGGSGKSTLLALVQCLYPPLVGTVLFDGQNVRHLDQRWLRRHIAFVPRRPTMLTGTIEYNLRAGAAHCSNAAIQAAVASVGLDDVIQQLPSGIRTRVGPAGVSLGRREMQLLGLARALVQHPAILLIDEGMSYLDAEEEATVFAALRRALPHATMIIVSHRQATLRHCDSICVMHRGKIKERGAHAELLASGGYYTRMMTMADLGDGGSVTTGGTSERSGSIGYGTPGRFSFLSTNSRGRGHSQGDMLEASGAVAGGTRRSSLGAATSIHSNHPAGLHTSWARSASGADRVSPSVVAELRSQLQGGSDGSGLMVSAAAVKALLQCSGVDAELRQAILGVDVQEEEEEEVEEAEEGDLASSTPDGPGIEVPTTS